MTPLRIVCWNVKTGAPTPAIRERLSQLGADVVLLQELDVWTDRVDGRNTAQALFGGPGPAAWSWTFAPSLQSAALQAEAPPALYGNLIAVRGRIVSSLSVTLGPLTADPVLHDRAPARERRTAIVARVECGTSNLVVACAHLAFGDDCDDLRHRQATELAATAAGFAGADDDLIVGVDLNATRIDVERWAMPSRLRVLSPAPIAFDVARRVGVDHFLFRGTRRAHVTLEDGEGLSDHDPIVLTLE